MRALCGAIISAGALFGLGLAAIGVGTRYAHFSYTDDKGEPQWVRFSNMDVALIIIIVLCIAALIVGIGIAILGLAYHHHRRYHEHLRLYGPGSSASSTTHAPLS